MIIKKKAHVPRKVKLEQRVEIPNRLKKQAFEYFSVKTTAQKLAITDKFLKKINENTSVLEIGSGSCRFADFLLRKTKLKSNNLELMDVQFNQKDLPFLKSLIYKLNKQGKIRLTKADMFEHEYNKKYHFVFIPNSFFSFVTFKDKVKRERFKEVVLKKYKGFLKEFSLTEVKQVESLNIFLKKIDQSLYLNGEVRLNYMSENILKLIKKTKSKNKIFEKYSFKEIKTQDSKDTGLIIKKIKV